MFQYTVLAPSMCFQSILSLLPITKDTQEVEEEVDDVQVQVDCSMDVFFWRDLKRPKTFSTNLYKIDYDKLQMLKNENTHIPQWATKAIV